MLQKWINTGEDKQVQRGMAARSGRWWWWRKQHELAVVLAPPIAEQMAVRQGSREKKEADRNMKQRQMAIYSLIVGACSVTAWRLGTRCSSPRLNPFFTSPFARSRITAYLACRRLPPSLVQVFVTVSGCSRGCRARSERLLWQEKRRSLPTRRSGAEERRVLVKLWCQLPRQAMLHSQSQGPWADVMLPAGKRAALEPAALVVMRRLAA